MFSKLLISCLFVGLGALTTVAQVNPGTYRIMNAKSGTALRSYRQGQPVYVSNTLEFPGPFAFWQIEDADQGASTIKNVGLNMFVSADNEDDGVSVITSSGSTSFAIQPAGQEEGRDVYVIKVVNGDLVWNAEPPVVPFGPVTLRASQGAMEQHWMFVAAGDDSLDPQVVLGM